MARKVKINITVGYSAMTPISSLRALLFRARQSLIIAALLYITFAIQASASYVPFNTNTKMNVGIGTSTPQAALVVTGGNVGIGTWTAAGGNLIVNGGGNVGIGTAWPGVALDVVGTVRATAFSGSGLVSGLTTGTIPQAASATTLSNSVITQSSGNIGIGVGSPGAPLEVNGSILADGSGNSYFSSGNLGIGTTTPQAAFVVTDGNVGIGTWTAAGGALIVNGGNVGIGSASPGVALDVVGTVRATAFSGSGLVSGLTTNYVPKASGAATLTNSLIFDNGTNVGINTSSPGQTLEVNGGLQLDGSGDSYLSSGNFGIGTTTPQSALVVSNGNVGIGTWTTNSGLQILTSLAVYRTAQSGSYNSNGDTIIGVTSTSSAYTVTLSAADAVAGRVIIIKDESGAAGTNHITVNTAGGKTIDGAASITISVNYGVLRVYSDGTNWFTF